jgi:hopanoid biosynthesis associated RND transporter like protein HpnN
VEQNDRLLDRLALWLVDNSRRFAVVVVLGCLAGAGALGWIAATRLGMDTDLDKLLSANEPWRQQEMAFDRAFPQFDDLLVAVVDGETPDAADDGAAALAARLAPRHDLFLGVSRPDANPLFRREGLLFLPVPEVAAVTAQVIEAQPFIGSLAADSSLRGLFGTLNLALDGVIRGDATFSQLKRPLEAITAAVAKTLVGHGRSLSWQSLLTGEKPRADELRRFVLLKVVRNFGELAAGEAAISAVRQAIQDLQLTADRGVRVRLTGSVAIENDELQTLSQGIGFSLELSLGLVCLVLFGALRSIRLILPIFVTLIVGLVATAGFAALAVGTLNPISVAFAVLFIGLAVDFSIQFTVRYREERYLSPDPAEALRHTAVNISGALVLAAAATALGFLSFLPTAYVGVSQLGLIAGFGMLIAVTLNFTLLPALLALFRTSAEPASVGFAGAAPIDRFLIERHRWVLVAAAGVGVVGIGLMPLLRFDFNPMDLRDPKTESVATALDLMANPDTSPFTAEILVKSVAEVPALVARLEALPEVHRVLAVTSFLPEQQDAKLAMIEDANSLLAPTLTPVSVAPPPDGETIRRTLAATVQRLRVLDREPGAHRLADLLDQVQGRNDAFFGVLSRTLLSGLPPRLEALRDALSAEPVTLASLPASLIRDWIAPDGSARIQVFPAGDAGDTAVLSRFVDAVRSVAPGATGTAVTVRESAATIVRAFIEAGVLALVAICALLWLVLRRVGDVLLVLGPLLLSSLMTAITSVIAGPVLNFANVIALPLLLGIGVAFNIYFVVNWRRGVVGPLQSSTARAIVFSALTTMVAFGTLALSNHPGTASMGILLMVSLSFTLLNTLVTLPALLGWATRIATVQQAARVPTAPREPPTGDATP